MSRITKIDTLCTFCAGSSRLTVVSNVAHDNKVIELTLYRYFTILEDNFKELHVRLSIEAKRSVEGVSLGKIVVKSNAIDSVTQNISMIAPEDIEKMVAEYIPVEIYDPVTKRYLLLGEMRELSRLCQDEVDQIATAVEKMCEC